MRGSSFVFCFYHHQTEEHHDLGKSTKSLSSQNYSWGGARTLEEEACGGDKTGAHSHSDASPKTSVMLRSLGILCLLGAALAAPSLSASMSDDLVTDLPGLTFTPNFKQYSGYLDGSQGNHLHYWLVESQTNPSTAPLVLWLNGGPGCSSLLGLLSENGPFRIQRDNATVIENVNSWNKAANILYLESPRDVGFSYRDSTATPDLLYNDDKTAADNALALIQFFQRFPQYQGRDFYITGESYGGVYVPTLTKLVVQMIQNNTTPYISLKGFAVGNGALSRQQLTNSGIDLLYYRGMLGTTQWENLRQCCPDTPQGPLVDCDFSQFVVFDNYGNPAPRNDTNDAQRIACGKMVIQLGLNSIWETYNDVYNSYQDCYNFDTTVFGGSEKRHAKVHQQTMRKIMRTSLSTTGANQAYNLFSNGINPFIDQGSLVNKMSTDALNNYPCYVDDATTSWLGRQDVRNALHIPASVQAWQECSDDINEKYYIQQYPDMTPIFKFLVDSAYPLKALIYNGDVDFACNYLGDQWFVENLANSAYKMTLTRQREQWNYTRAGTQNTYQPTLAGYLKSWSYSKFQLDLLTVKGAGHMVPMDRPGPALQLFHNFLYNGQNGYSAQVPYDVTAAPLRSQYAAPPQKTWTRKQADRVWNLPGITYGLNFKQYSGYLNGVTGNYLHYWFVESQGNPTSDPLVLWLTGGPGCSGLMAMLTELGPFHPNPDGKTLFENVYSWNKAANIIFLESPRGVGFSVQDPSLNNDTIWDDQRTATDTYLALKDFLTVYPEYINRPFFVTGESYGGVYVPTITSLLIDKIQSGDFPQLNLIGMSIGNGELSAIQQFNSAIMMSYFHGLFSKDDFDSLQQCCNQNKTSSQWFEYCNFAQYIHLGPDGTAIPNDNSFCANKVADLGQQRFWNSLNDVYNIYQDCYEDSSRAFGSRMTIAQKKLHLKGFIDQGAKISTSSTDNQGGLACYGTTQAASWINLPDVRSALHVSSAAGQWSACNDTINGLYVQQHNDTTSVFQHILDSKYPLRVLIYNGDVDQACNYLGDQWFIEAFALKNQLPVTKARADWRYMTQIAGYAKKFDNKAGFSIDLITVKGAGHLVPTDRPGPALQMIANFFRNQDYSNPTVIDTSLHPLTNTYVVAEQLAASLNRSLTGVTHNGNRVHTKVHKVVRADKFAKTGEQESVKQPSERAGYPPPPTQTKAQDEVTNLPGLTFTPNFKQYSGYLNASAGNYLHYWLVESQQNPGADPLILWLNGGPGCSSIGGFLEELGPFHVNSDGKTLFENTFSWNKAGNVLFLEAPRDVGYSFRSNEFPADTMYNDTYTASDTVLALGNFFDKFPEYQNRPFYITGESYGGVYVPTLTRALINAIQAKTLQRVNLVGVAIGNGELSGIQQINSAVSLLYFRGEHDKSDWDAISKCCDTSVPQAYCDYTQYINIDTSGNVSPKLNDNSLAAQCGQLVTQQGFLDVWTTDNDVYNTFADCYSAPAAGDSKLNELARGIRRVQNRRTKRSADVSPFLPSQLFVDQAKKINYQSTDANGGFTCFSGDASEAYMNIPEVRAALHIPTTLPYWTDCNLVMNENYIQQHNDTTSVFNDILASSYPLRFLIYNGDVDMACQFLGDQWFIEKLAKNNNMAVTHQHSPWNYTQGQYLPRVGGYWKQFTYTKAGTNTKVVFDQLTVKGAGHFVPQDRPGPALQMIYNFVNQLDYNKNLTLDYSRKPLLAQYQPAPVTVPRRKADHIFALPGVTWNVNFMQHSGYLQATQGNKLFYWFIESQSGNEGDPIILWLQGGPGCASTGGLLGEIGPFFVNPDGETLFENVYSWNKAAHILIIDSPRGVGFSYQDTNQNKDQTWDDDKTALDTYTALEDFFAAYTPHRNSELYITGESYGGVYVPTLTRLLIQKIQAGQSNIKLRGMGIGNGFVSATNDVRTLPDFLYFHGIYDKPQWEKLRACCPSSDVSYDCNYDYYITFDSQMDVIAKSFPNNQTLQDCANLVEQLSFDRNWKAMYDQYNLYQDCYVTPRDQSSPFTAKQERMSRLELERRLKSFIPQSQIKTSQFDPLSTDATGGYSCWNIQASDHYLSLPHVRDALHIPDQVQRWTFCANLNYTCLYNDTTQVFTDILNSGYDLKVLIYNGDVDSVCSMFEAESLVNNLAINQNFVVNQPRGLWLYGGQIGGYVQKFQKSNLTIDLLTVKGAGHMSPTDRPGPVLQMINNFVHGQGYNTTIGVSMLRQPLLAQYTEQNDGPTMAPTNLPPASNPTVKTTTTTTVATTTQSSSLISVLFSVFFVAIVKLFLHIKAIVYNKTRKYAGHTIDLNLGDNATVAEAKSKIEEITTVPSQIQWIVFGTTHLDDSKPLREYGIRDGYTIYSTPTYVEIQDMPNL
uniref:Carboxypeptidase n=1 Tax=Caenorhabditis tropicalis TaxID=1561998 RepID=A0A1I7TJ55_9PELO